MLRVMYNQPKVFLRFGISQRQCRWHSSICRNTSAGDRCLWFYQSPLEAALLYLATLPAYHGRAAQKILSVLCGWNLPMVPYNEIGNSQINYSAFTGPAGAHRSQGRTKDLKAIRAGWPWQRWNQIVSSGHCAQCSCHDPAGAGMWEIWWSQKTHRHRLFGMAPAGLR